MFWLSINCPPWVCPLRVRGKSCAWSKTCGWCAYVRPHELRVERYHAGGSGIVAELQRAIVVGPVARLELWPQTPSATPGQDRLIEAQMSCERFAELGLRQGEKLLLSPRQAKVFLQV